MLTLKNARIPDYLSITYLGLCEVMTSHGGVFFSKKTKSEKTVKSKKLEAAFWKNLITKLLKNIQNFSSGSLTAYAYKSILYTSTIEFVVTEEERKIYTPAWSPTKEHQHGPLKWCMVYADRQQRAIKTSGQEHVSVAYKYPSTQMQTQSIL